MPFDPVEELLARIARSRGEWPLKSEAATWRRVLAWRAFLESDREALKIVADWRDRNREYKVDGLGERIADAWADHLFSEDLVCTAANEADQPNLDLIVEENELTEECRGAERDYVASEGEGFWRWYVDPDVADVPMLEWHSRASVAPYYVGRKLMAVALITVLEGRGNLQESSNAVWRHFEVHAEGVVQHVLYRGTDRRLGTEVPLDAHPETEDLAATLGESQRWNHDGPMLMGRVINKRGRKPSLGVSEYVTVKDQLLDLNEAATIGTENMRLTAKKRAVVPASALQQAPASRRPPGFPSGEDLVDDGEGGFLPTSGHPMMFNAGEDLLVIDPLNEEMGKDANAQFQVLEYSFDAEALIAYKRDLVETALTRLGITPSWVGITTGDGDGYAVSGTHLRLRMIPTTKAGHGKGKKWDRELPRMLRAGQYLSALPENLGGLGLSWVDALAMPKVQRGNPLPTDEVEQSTIEATLVQAGVKSVRQSVMDQHPDWPEERVDEEVDAIRADRAAAAPSLGGFA